MTKRTFSKHLETLYDDLCLIVDGRYQHHGRDALHDALLSIYEKRSYKRLHPSLSAKKITGWLVQSVIFHIRRKLRGESKYSKRYSLLSSYDMEDLGGLEESFAGPEYPVALVRDVQRAIGTLSAYHQQLIIAQFYEGRTYREIAHRLGTQASRIFTETEIAKAYLRTQLESYRT